MEYMHELKDKLCRELEHYADKSNLSASDLETVDKLTHSIKSIETILAMRGDYSKDRYSRDHYSYDDYSNKRDSMGRYSRDDDRAHITRELRELMHRTADESVKRAIKQAVSEIER